MKKNEIQLWHIYRGRGPGLRRVEEIRHHPIGIGPVRPARDRVFVTWLRAGSFHLGRSHGRCSLTAFARWAVELVDNGAQPKISSSLKEEAAISALKRLARRWPETLWLFSGSGSLCVMQCGENGERVMTSGGVVDQDYVVATIDIPNEGGGW